MNNNLCVLQKEYETLEDMLSAMYQLWTMDGMKDRAVYAGDTKLDLEFEEHTSAYTKMGIPEPVFCAYFHHALVPEIEFTQSFMDCQYILFRAILIHNRIKIVACGRENQKFFDDLEKKMETFHPAPVYPHNCYHTMDFSREITGDVCPEKVTPWILQGIGRIPVLSDKIMVSTKTCPSFHPVTAADTDITYIYAYDEKTQTLIVYDVRNDNYASANVDLKAKDFSPRP